MTPKLDTEYLAFFRELGWEIEGPAYTTIPMVRVEYTMDNEELLERLGNFLLSKYIIKDHYDKDHTSRRAFRRELYHTFPDAVEWLNTHNKLRRNNIAGANSYMFLIKRSSAIQQHQTLALELDTIWKSSELERAAEVAYNNLELPAKIAYVKVLDKVVYQFLEALSK